MRKFTLTAAPLSRRTPGYMSLDDRTFVTNATSPSYISLSSDVCRNNHVLPRSSKVVLAIECKYYVNSKPGLALGRGFLGLREEIQRDNRFFIAISHSKSVEKLLAKHTRDFDLMFTPVIPHDVSVMRSVFKSVFAKFKAQHN